MNIWSQSHVVHMSPSRSSPGASTRSQSMFINYLLMPSTHTSTSSINTPVYTHTHTHRMRDPFSLPTCRGESRDTVVVREGLERSNLDGEKGERRRVEWKDNREEDERRRDIRTSSLDWVSLCSPLTSINRLDFQSQAESRGESRLSLWSFAQGIDVIIPTPHT